MEPVWTVARRAEAEARAEHPCYAGKQTRLPRNARRAANRARGRCRKRHAAAAASDGSAKCVEGLNAAMLRIRNVSEIEATDRPSQLSYPTPAPRSRGAAVAPLRAVRGPGASPPPVSGQREIFPGGRPRRGSRGRGQGSDSAISATPYLATLETVGGWYCRDGHGPNWPVATWRARAKPRTRESRRGARQSRREDRDDARRTWGPYSRPALAGRPPPRAPHL